VDTGAETDAISLTRAQIEKIKPRRLDKTSCTMDATGQKRVLHYYVADEIVIDHYRFTHCEIMEMPSAQGQFDDIGLIGLGFLQYFTFYFDWKNDCLMLYPPQHPPRIDPAAWQVIHLDKRHRFKAQLPGYKKIFNTLFDTGAVYVNGEEGYNLIRVDAKELADRFETRLEYDHPVITTNLIIPGKSTINHLCFFLYETPGPDDAEILLGYDFFSQYEVIVDYPASNVYFR
jgi:hypothetical protein